MGRLHSLRRGPERARVQSIWIATLLILVFTVGYIAFEWGFNLPIAQWPEAIAQLQMPTPDPPFRFGLAAIRDAFLVVHETRDLPAWGGMGFVVWHSGYFTVCVWLVLYLMTGPRLLPAKTPLRRPDRKHGPGPGT
jgi:hypothetical protein